MKLKFGDPEEKERVGGFRKDQSAEDFIQELNLSLRDLEDKLSAGLEAPKLPVTFVLGVPRCGSTLFMQIAVSSFELAYPSNLMARFFLAPSVGAWLHRLLIPKAVRKSGEFESQYGVTASPEEPHEFGYFWTSHFPVGTTHQLSEEELANVDAPKLRRSLASIEDVLGKPCIFKSLNMDFLVTFLFRELPKTLFVYVRRAPYFLAQSIYLGRISRYGTPDAWWSLRPGQYEALKKLDNFHQVAGQVWAIIGELERQLDGIPQRNKLIIDYEAMCRHPERELAKYAKRMSDLGAPLNRIGPPLEKLPSGDVHRLSPEEKSKLQAAIEEMRDRA
jgi:hypothetical protein